MSRRAARRDANEPEIAAALTACGWTVDRLDGDGVPDLIAGKLGVNVLLEVKLPAGLRGGLKGRKLTPKQVEWHGSWRGQVAVVRDADQAIKAAEEQLARLRENQP